MTRRERDCVFINKMMCFLQQKKTSSDDQKQKLSSTVVVAQGSVARLSWKLYYGW